MLSTDWARPFLIVSPGRTATKWLAWVMNHSKEWTVQHEPVELPYDEYTGAVSPPHLLQMVKGRRIPIHHTLGVIIREPIAQAISIQNRARVFRAPCEKLYLEHAWSYFKMMEKLIEEHEAVPISYEVMTTSRPYLETILYAFGINDFKPTEDMLRIRKNNIENPPFTVLAGDMRKVVEKFAIPFWEKYGVQKSV